MHWSVRNIIGVGVGALLLVASGVVVTRLSASRAGSDSERLPEAREVPLSPRSHVRRGTPELTEEGPRTLPTSAARDRLLALSFPGGRPRLTELFVTYDGNVVRGSRARVYLALAIARAGGSMAELAARAELEGRSHQTLEVISAMEAGEAAAGDADAHESLGDLLHFQSGTGATLARWLRDRFERCGGVAFSEAADGYVLGVR